MTAPNGDASAYISFWPEIESLIGQVTQLFKPRPARHPATYADEIAADGGYMRRPADYSVTLTGIDDATIVRLWAELAESQYDFLHWNCSNVCKFLLLSAIPVGSRAALVEAMGLCPDETNCIDSADTVLEKLRFLSTSAFIDCRPEDLKRAADACLAAAT